MIHLPQGGAIQYTYEMTPGCNNPGATGVPVIAVEPAPNAILPCYRVIRR